VRTVLKSAEPVTLSVARAVLEEAGVVAHELDVHTSVVEGSIGHFIPRRVAVADSDYETARRALIEAGLQPFEG
jgi:hypothetical protein